MNNIAKRRAEIWCTRFNQLMKSNGYTQETFLKEYKNKYGGGTQANVSRWMRVGNTIQKDGTCKTIGFPSYENMLNIADFFGVTIGYLTGETDFETFEMEKSCKYIGIDEKTGNALRNIASGKSIRFGKHYVKEIGAVLRNLLTSQSFPAFINALRECAENIYYRDHPINHIAEAEGTIKKEVRELALQCLDYQQFVDEQYGEIDDFEANNIEPTEELLKAITLLNVAISQNYVEKESSEQKVKLSEYELQKIYFQIISDVMIDENLPEMTTPRYGENELIGQKKCILSDSLQHQTDAAEPSETN